MIFSPTSFKIYASIKFKLHGKRLIPVQSVKYLAVLLDKHLQWTEHLSYVKMKFNRAIDILSKLRHTSNLNMKITYQSLFCSHFPYACQLWGQKNQTSNPNTSNRALKIIFKKSHDFVNSIYKELYTLKFKDLIEQNKQLAASFPRLKYCDESHNYMTRSAAKKLPHVPTKKTDRYG